jgi:hypothetical protein
VLPVCVPTSCKTLQFYSSAACCRWRDAAALHRGCIRLCFLLKRSAAVETA